MDEIISALLNLEVIGTVAAFVLVTIQGLKVFKFVTDDAGIAKAAIITALVGGGGMAAGELYTPIAPFIGLFFTFYVSTMVAGLGYKYLVAPILEKFGLEVSVKELSK